MSALPLVVGTMPAMAGGTTGVKSTGRVEVATAARPKAFEPGAYGNVGGIGGWHFLRCRAVAAVADDIRAICVPSAGRFGAGKRDLVMRVKKGKACDGNDDDGEGVSVPATSWLIIDVINLDDALTIHMPSTGKFGVRRGRLQSPCTIAPAQEKRDMK